MASLPQYAQKAFIAGSKLVTSLNNPRRQPTHKCRVFRLDYKGYDSNRPDVWGIPYIYDIEEIDFQSYGTEEEEVIAIFEFKTEE